MGSPRTLQNDMHKVHALVLRSDKHAVETKRGRNDSAVMSSIAPLVLHWRAQLKLWSQKGAYQQRVYGVAKFLESL